MSSTNQRYRVEIKTGINIVYSSAWFDENEKAAIISDFVKAVHQANDNDISSVTVKNEKDEDVILPKSTLCSSPIVFAKEVIEEKAKATKDENK